MKIEKIEQKEGVYHVSLKPNFLEKLFGIKPRIEEFKRTSSIFAYGGGAVYRRKNGEDLPNHHFIGEAIDKFRRKW